MDESCRCNLTQSQLEELDELEAQESEDYKEKQSYINEIKSKFLPGKQILLKDFYDEIRTIDKVESTLTPHTSIYYPDPDDSCTYIVYTGYWTPNIRIWFADEDSSIDYKEGRVILIN